MISETVLKIPGGFIRIIEESDVTKEYIEGLNDPEINQFLEVRHNPQTLQSVVDFVRLNRESRDMILWGIWFGKNKTAILIGTVRLHGVNTVRTHCDIGICLFNKATWGKGLGTAAIKEVTAWALRVFKIQTIQAGVYSNNIASQKAFINSGYEHSYERPDSVQIYLANRNSIIG